MMGGSQTKPLSLNLGRQIGSQHSSSRNEEEEATVFMTRSRSCVKEASEGRWGEMVDGRDSRDASSGACKMEVVTRVEGCGVVRRVCSSASGEETCLRVQSGALCSVQMDEVVAREHQRKEHLRRPRAEQLAELGASGGRES